MPPLPPRMLEIREPAAVVASAPVVASPGQATALAQLGAWRTQLKAEETVRAARSAVSAPPPLRVAPARVRGRLWWRVVAGPMRPEEAQALCLRMSQVGTPCWVRALGAE